MKKKEEIVKEMIESGEYYKEGLKWYNSRYVRPKTQLVHMSIFAAIAVVFFLIIFVMFIRIFPLTNHIGFVMERSFKKDETITIKSIAGKDKNATLGVIKFYLAEYVKSREEWIEDKIDRNFKFVTEASNDKVFDEFLEENDTSNPDNPIYTLGSQVIRKIRINQIQLPLLPEEGFQIDPTVEHRSKVIYTERQVFLDGTSESTQRVADVSFRYKEIIIDQEDHEIKQLPEVVITDYKTREL